MQPDLRRYAWSCWPCQREREAERESSSEMSARGSLAGGNRNRCCIWRQRDGERRLLTVAMQPMLHQSPLTCMSFCCEVDSMICMHIHIYFSALVNKSSNCTDILTE
jgi:hypothetical protein